jgi:hypothetical protein
VAQSTGGESTFPQSVCPPHRGVHGRTPADPAQRARGKGRLKARLRREGPGKAKGHAKGEEKRGPKGKIKAGGFGLRPLKVLLLQYEGYLYVDLVALDVAILYQYVLVLNPRPFDAPKRLGGTGDGLLDGIVEARLRGGAQLGHSGNAHTNLCLLTA